MDERVASGLHRTDPLRGRRRCVVSAVGADVSSAALGPGRAVDSDQRRVSELLREGETDGAPPHTRFAAMLPR
ncbi:hypothetical protein JOD57_004406 [Geodermatophilus bullaregiensis]|nr:hypothetical protein [Geodermatophilus bullaregiensis]